LPTAGRVGTPARHHQPATLNHGRTAPLSTSPGELHVDDFVEAAIAGVAVPPGDGAADHAARWPIRGRHGSTDAGGSCPAPGPAALRAGTRSVDRAGTPGTRHGACAA